MSCQTKSELLSNGASIVENKDGTVSVFVQSQSNSLQPYFLTKPCCEALDSRYVYDVNNQKCRWNGTTNPSLASSRLSCAGESTFKVVLNPEGNDGTIFSTNGGEDCSLEIAFDYLFKFSCDDNITLADLESFEADVNLDIINPTAQTLTTIFEEQIFNIGSGNTFDYLRNNVNSGLYLCGDPDCTPLIANDTNNTVACDSLFTNIFDGLVQEALITDNITLTQQNYSNYISGDTFNSNWLHYSNIITDESILSAITNQKIKISIKIKNTNVDVCILLDKIELNRKCTNIESNNIFISKSPGFQLERIIDNKKSWVSNTNPEERIFDLTSRQTDYNVNHHKLVINTKELDLDISASDAIENDLWCYIRDNDCILSGISSSCITSGDTTYSCPVGYTADTGNTNCTKLTFEGAILSGTPFTAYTGAINNQYNQNGANFYENITNFAKPLVTSATTNNVYNTTGGTLGLVTTIVSNFWGSNPSCTGCTATEAGKKGRLNNVGIWGSTGDTTPLGIWIGFATCFNLPATKTYYVGVSADNGIRIKLNGEIIVLFNNTNQFNFRTWHMFPMTLQAGLNIIELEGINLSAIASFGAEIYDADLNTLTGATSSGQTNIVFSTSNEIGNEFLLGEFSGYTCSSGFAMDNCSSGSPVCVKIERQSITGTSTTTSGCCGDFNVDLNSLITSDLSKITTLSEFETIITSELINARCRKTMSAYPTLRLLYDRYINSTNYCDTVSSGFDYDNMSKFISLIGTYWVDLIEQVVPTTTIWGSTYIYNNTIFDAQKFKYKSYTLFTCNEPTDFPFSAIGSATTVEVLTTTYTTDNSGNTTTSVVDVCDGVYIMQQNYGSEFLGRVTIIGDSEERNSINSDGDIIIINE